MNIFCPVSIILVVIFIETSYACSGYQLKVTEISQCGGPDQLVWFDNNFNANVTTDCAVVAYGCINFKSFGSAQASVSVRKNNELVLEENQDLCNIPQKVRSHFKIPMKCPAQESKVCYNGQSRVSIKSYRRLLHLVEGKYDVSLNIDHDTGRSCIRMKFEFLR